VIDNGAANDTFAVDFGPRRRGDPALVEIQNKLAIDGVVCAADAETDDI
jgi:hypothetical protein